jgi:hypothetical protein
MNQNIFKPRLDSHFDLSSLATSIIEPELYSKVNSAKPKYSIKVNVSGDNEPTSFDISIYGKSSRLIEGTKAMRKIIHEVVASLLSKETDMKLRTIGVTGGDGNLSPDFIDQDKKMVVELTTTVNVDSKNVVDRFNQKMVHYRDALSETGYGIGIAVVGETFVYSNLDMSQEMIDALCQRCRVGLAIKSTIERYLGVSLNPNDSTAEESLVIDIIKGMNGESKSSKEFPMKDILECSKKPSKSDFMIANRILRTELKESKKKSVANKSLLNDYVNSYTGNSRTDKKRITNIPMIEPVLSDPESELTNYEISNSKMPTWMKKIWISSLSAKAINDPIIYSLEEQIKEAMDSSKPEEDSKHRVQKNSAFNVHLDAEDLEMASTTGLFGKSQKSSVLYRENKRKNKLSFHPLNTETSDIKEFINDVKLTEETHLNAIPDDIRSLIRDAKSVWSADSLESISELMLKNISRTRLLNFTGLITKLFTEICYCYKYWIGRSDFYVKKICGVYILIRCTGTHIFCSFAYPKDYYSKFDTGRLGPTIFESEEWYFSDFSSFTEPVVEHFVKSGPYFVSILAHLMCSLELDIQDKPCLSETLSKDVNGILLLFLNNKTDAEEIMTSQRFLTMTVLEDLDPNPYRFVERLPGFIKSRLSSFLIGRTIDLMTRYTTPPIRMLVKDGENSVIEYDGIVSFFSNSEITFKRKIEEFYYGYVISKEKGRGGDRNFKIMKKIVEQEYVYRDNNFSEFSHSERTRTNQTNIPVMKVLCYLMKERMKENYGDAWSSVMEKKIIERLSRLTFTELATLKVSSRDYSGKLNIPHVDDTMSVLEIKEKLKILNPEDVKSRPRVMESLTTLIEDFKKDAKVKDVEHIMQIVPWCLKGIEKRGFFFSDIFPKPQHGGDREIHVLEIKMRVCQLFVEHISRSLCEMTQSDTLMHPKWKSSFVKNHYDRAENELDTHRVTMGKSADAAKWCQRNHASKFAAALSSFLPEWLLKPVLRILFLWTTKVICFPIQFVANFIANKNVKSNRIYERMRDEFYSGTGIFKDAISNRMTIKSGMMQGILHYTSSFVHGIIQESMISLQQRVLRSQGIRSVITMAQGSDDSAELISVSGKSVRSLIATSVTMLHWKENLSKHIGIYTSRAKSCIGSSDMIEYNSEWYTRKNSIMPTFRWVSACLEVGVVERFIDRVHNFYGTATNVIESGGRILEVAVIQESQAWMHYIMLGLGNHSLSKETSNYIRKLKDPALGYFPLDSDFNAGITGVDFQLYKYHKDSDYGYGIGSSRINSAELLMYEEDTKTSTVSQSLRKVRIRFGENKIFSDLLRKMSAPELEDLIEEVEKKPRLLYYPPRHWSESKLNIFMKLFEPGVKESLSRHSATARVLAASAYMISKPCLTKSGSPGKMSLYKALVTENTNRIMERVTKLSVEEVFLYNDEYKDTLNDIKDIMENSVLQKVNLRSRSKQTIQVFDRVLNDIPIIEMCKEKWFDDGRTGLTLRQFDIKWKELQERFKFIKNSRIETKESLKMTEVQLKNFLVSIDSRPRKLTLMDTSAKGNSVKSSMTRLFWPNVKLLKTGSNAKNEDTASSLRSKIFSIVTHWASSSEKKKTIVDLISSSSVLSEKTVPQKVRKIKCIKDFLSGVSYNKLIDDIISGKIGNLGLFTIRQSGYGENRTGYGEWKGIVLNSNVRVELEGPICTRITLSNLRNKSELGRSLLELIRNINAKFPDEGVESDHWLSPDGIINGGKGIMRAIPIILDDYLRVTIFDDILDWEWFFDMRYNTLRLRANSGRGEILTLISDTFKSYEWDPLYTFENDIFGNWNNSEPMNAEVIGYELSTTFNNTDATTLKEIKKINSNSKTAVSSSGWHLLDFKNVLKSFFSLRITESDIKKMEEDKNSGKVKEPEKRQDNTTLDISEEELLFFQTGDFKVDLDLIQDVGNDEDDYEFDMDFTVKGYIEEHIEMLLTEREVSQIKDNNAMPPTNLCLSSIEGLSKSLTGKSLRDIYIDCINDDSKRYSGIMGKILTLVTETPRVLRRVTEFERNVFKQEEDAVSATISLRTEKDLDMLDEDQLNENIRDIDQLIKSTNNVSLIETLLQSRARYINMLNLMDIKLEDNTISRIPSRDILLWVREESGIFSNELNLLFRLSDSAYILSFRDRLDNHVEVMRKEKLISEYEVGLYREAIPKPHLTTLFLDVLSDYLKINLTVGPYCTNKESYPSVEFNSFSRDSSKR